MDSNLRDKLNMLVIFPKYIKNSSNEIMILTTSKPVDSGKNLIIGLLTTHIP